MKYILAMWLMYIVWMVTIITTRFIMAINGHEFPVWVFSIGIIIALILGIIADPMDT